MKIMHTNQNFHQHIRFIACMNYIYHIEWTYVGIQKFVIDSCVIYNNSQIEAQGISFATRWMQNIFIKCLSSRINSITCRTIFAFKHTNVRIWITNKIVFVLNILPYKLLSINIYIRDFIIYQFMLCVIIYTLQWTFMDIIYALYNLY